MNIFACDKCIVLNIFDTIVINVYFNQLQLKEFDSNNIQNEKNLNTINK